MYGKKIWKNRKKMRRNLKFGRKTEERWTGRGKRWRKKVTVDGK